MKKAAGLLLAPNSDKEDAHGIREYIEGVARWVDRFGGSNCGGELRCARRGENTGDVAAQSPPSPSASAQPQAPASLPGEENASKKDEALVVDPCADIDYSNIVDCRSGTCYCYRAIGTEYRWCNWWWRQVTVWQTYVC